MIEVLKQALDALETEVSIDWTNNDEFNASAEKMHDAIASLRQAIAELESQEPVAWVWVNNKGWLNYGETPHDMFKSSPLYTHPPQRSESSGKPAVWVGLTEQDFSAINQSCLTKLQAATSAESILKEKNT
jgi:cytochrome c556